MENSTKIGYIETLGPASRRLSLIRIATSDPTTGTPVIDMHMFDSPSDAAAIITREGITHLHLGTNMVVDAHAFIAELERMGKA